MQTLTILTQLLGLMTEEHDMYVQVVAVITAFAVSAGINTKDVMAVCVSTVTNSPVLFVHGARTREQERLQP